jgi:hypothetical protein
MSAVQGIVFETDMNTKKRYVRIDFDRYGKAMMPFFTQIGIIDANDDFWEEYATGITGDELRHNIYQRIDAWKWNER